MNFQESIMCPTKPNWLDLVGNSAWLKLTFERLVPTLQFVHIRSEKQKAFFEETCSIGLFFLTSDYWQQHISGQENGSHFLRKPFPLSSLMHYQENTFCPIKPNGLGLMGHISTNNFTHQVRKRKPLFEKTIFAVASYSRGALLKIHIVSHQWIGFDETSC